MLAESTNETRKHPIRLNRMHRANVPVEEHVRVKARPGAFKRMHDVAEIAQGDSEQHTSACVDSDNKLEVENDRTNAVAAPSEPNFNGVRKLGGSAPAIAAQGYTNQQLQISKIYR